MSRAREIAAELNAAQASREHRTGWVHSAREIITSQADDLWRAFVAYLVGEVKTIADTAPIAGDAGLSTQEIGNTLVISTRQLPTIRLIIIYTPKSRIGGTLTEQFTALSAPKISEIVPFRFTVDSRSETCLTDGERFLSPQHVGDEFLEHIQSFFREAMKRPNILS